jgi:hypothetical protein
MEMYLHIFELITGKPMKQILMYAVVSKIFWTDAVEIIKLSIRLIDHHHPQSSSLPHVEASPTVSSIFGTHP